MKKLFLKNFIYSLLFFFLSNKHQSVGKRRKGVILTKNKGVILSSFLIPQIYLFKHGVQFLSFFLLSSCSGVENYT